MSILLAVLGTLLGLITVMAVSGVSDYNDRNAKVWQIAIALWFGTATAALFVVAFWKGGYF